MMNFLSFHCFSLSNKLAAIVIASWLLITVLIISFFVGQDLLSLRKSTVEDLSGLARVIGVNCIASLEFVDSETATEVLTSLSARPKIHYAALYTKNHALFAHYLSKNEEQDNKIIQEWFPYNVEKYGQEAFFFSDNHLELYTPIRMGMDTVGILLLRANFDFFSQKLFHTGIIAGIILCASLFFAWIVSSLLQRLLSNPVLEMADAMRRVRDEKNYTVRIDSSYTGELQILAGGFNDMLDHLQERDGQLMDAKQAAEDANRAKSRFLAQMSHEIILRQCNALCHVRITKNLL